MPGVFAHSDFVMKTVGCGCVCERAAVMTGGRLLVGKTAMQGRDARAGRGGKRMIQVVGHRAGGDARGARLRRTTHCAVRR